jgi:hypothetical protein
MSGFPHAGFTVCMSISCGVWRALAPIPPREVAVRGALATATLSFLISG